LNDIISGKKISIFIAFEIFVFATDSDFVFAFAKKTVKKREFKQKFICGRTFERLIFTHFPIIVKRLVEENRQISFSELFTWLREQLKAKRATPQREEKQDTKEAFLNNH